MPGRTLDVHVHLIPPEVQRGPGEGSSLPKLEWEDGRQVIDYRGRRISAMVSDFGDLDRMIERTAALGIDRLLLSPWVNLLAENFDGDEAQVMAERQNRGLLRAVEAHPGRALALGTVPLRDPPDAAAHLRDLVQAPGFEGVEISSSVEGDLLGHDRFRPFWAAAEETGVLVFIHPSQQGLGIAGLTQHRLWNLVGNPTETALTAAHMVMAGVMEDHPGLKVLLAHGGGTILSLRGRLEHGWKLGGEVTSQLRHSPDESLRRFFYDTVTHDSHMLRRLVEFAGADHVLLGSDHPFDMAPADPVGFVKSAGLAPADEDLVLGAAAVAILRGGDRHQGNHI